MRKGMKRISTFVLLIAMMVMMIPAMAFATEVKEEKVAIYVQVPADWKSPCVWAWDEDGNNAFESWPGGEMEADTTNEGWYYIWLPDWAKHVIVNANEGEVQTEEQVLEGKSAWITVSTADAAEISYEKQTEGETPEYVEKFEIHAKVDKSWEAPCLWAWSAPDGTNASESWPGMEMKEDENGWYTAKAPTWVNSIIINANEGEVQTEDISIDAAEVWVTVEADGVFNFSYKDPDKAEIMDITVHVITPAEWDEPCLWAWSAPDGTNVYTTWPGEALEEDENNWLQKEIPGWVNSIIVNANEGEIQTTDISVDMGKEVWIVVGGPENFEVSYEEPEVSVETMATEEAEITEATEATEAAELTDQPVGENSNLTPVIVIVAFAAVVAIIVGAIVVKKKSAIK